MGLDVESRARFNLKSAKVLVAESSGMSIEILGQILIGFGAKDMQRAESVEEAKALVAKTSFDLALVGASIGEEDGCELVEWIRQQGPDANRHVPLLMVSAHTPISRVERARDCGAHFLITKPLTPVVLLERMLWIVREQRRFVSCDRYTGPDRRFKFDGPPEGGPGRRRDDLSADVGDAVAPNMSQDQIDALLNGKAASA